MRTFGGMLSARCLKRRNHCQPHIFSLCRQCYRRRFCGFCPIALRDCLQLPQSTSIYTYMAAGFSSGVQYARQRPLAGTFSHRFGACRHNMCHCMPPRFCCIVLSRRTNCPQHSMHTPCRPLCHDRGFQKARRVGHCHRRLNIPGRTQWCVGDWKHSAARVESLVARQ